MIDQASPLALALEEELDCALKVLDGFLGQIHVTHAVGEEEYFKINSNLTGIQFRYKQLQSLFMHKFKRNSWTD